ncbi:TcaA 3rd/4th domain-containing protein [Shouchella lonarensis]|uniref:Uncharacterized membrane protein YvbJ n=1 Tax=Shouchella lonarensis TaxID=1464122 RepID=A0A1G6GVW1_9BACI|nr:hypothetical protein [Shouchella lonarensis]SDB86071.1 Uncharacterized membrane protein YvbJ [Shouchella lonarensis]
MNCQQCQAPLSGTEGFCSQCGAKVNIAPPQPKKPFFTKKRIQIFAVVGGVFIAGGIAYQVGSYIHSPDRVVRALEKAVENEDAEGLVKLLSSNRDDWEVGLKEAEALLDYLKEDERSMDRVMTTLFDQADMYRQQSGDAKRDIDQIYGDVSASLLLKETGRSWFLYDTYEIEMIPVHLEASVPEEAILYFNDEEVPAVDKENDLYGPFGPGKYELKMTFPDALVDVEVTETVTLFDVYSDREHALFDSDVREVSVTAAHDDMDLYVNGEKTDVTVGEGETSLGSLPTDGSVTMAVEKSFPWGKVRSEDVEIDGGYMYVDEFPVVSEEQQGEIMEMLNEHRAQYVEALESGDGAKMKHASKEYQEEIEEAAEHADDIDLKLKKAEYALPSFGELNYNGGKERYEIELEVAYTHKDPNEFYSFSDRVDKDHARVTNHIAVYYDEGNKKWMVSTSQEGYGDYAFRNEEDVKVYDL